MSTFLLDTGIINALATNKEDFYTHYFVENKSGIKKHTKIHDVFSLGIIDLKHYETRLDFPYNNRINKLTLKACSQINDTILAAKEYYGAHRIGVALGTTEGGNEELLAFLKNKEKEKRTFTLQTQSLDIATQFLKQKYGLLGTSFTISTACTSSAHALIRADYLIKNGFCDAMLVGGVDIVSDVVVLGFHSLGAVDKEITMPFSQNRQGINIGEGAAFFLMSKDNFLDIKNPTQFLAGYDNSDAFHMTSPDTVALASSVCIQNAIKKANKNINDIDYISLHGTGTKLNDIMESNTLHNLGASHIPCSSLKPITGHTLGAASAMELALSFITLSDLNTKNILPPHIYDNKYDQSLQPINLVTETQYASRLNTILSTSYAFGGNNACLVISRERG